MSLNNVCGALIEAGFLTNSLGSGSVALTNTPTTLGNLLVAQGTSSATWQSLTASSVVGTNATGALVANGALSTTQTALGAGVSVGAGAGTSTVLVGAGATGGANGCVVVGHGALAPLATSTLAEGSIVLGNATDASGYVPSGTAQPALCLPTGIGKATSVATDVAGSVGYLRVVLNGAAVAVPYFAVPP